MSVIVPARNEEASLGACLESLTAQTGLPFEIIVVDDHSTDRTREIASSFPNVRILDAGPLPEGWTGKNNAVTTGARAARGDWLLFTDADTVHLPGSLARALAEAQQHGADLLSYSPEQIAITFWEMATLPVVFAELARQYPPAKVSDPDSPIAAANGQFILIRRDAYDAVGGHAAFATDLLEDVALARAVKRSGRTIRFRYAADAVRTRMYRDFSQLREGWTKNLALLFPQPGWLAVKTLFWWTFALCLLFLPALIGIGAGLTRNVPWLASAQNTFLTGASILKTWWLVWMTMTFFALCRNIVLVQRANVSVIMESRGVLFGMPMFAYLLFRSKRAHANGSIAWKDRTYSDKAGLLATGH